MKKTHIWGVLLLLLPTVNLAQTKAVSQQEYMRYIRATADEAWDNLDASRQRWRENIDLEWVFGYNPPSNDLYLAALNVNIYEITKESKYLDRAKALLLYFDEYRKAYPADFHKTQDQYGDELPVLPNIFSFGKYMHAYGKLKKYNYLTESEDQEIREVHIAPSADYLVRFQEWGAMNRAMLRAEAMLYAAKVVPDHPNQPRWKVMGEAILNDNWNKWEIEDASGYNAIWFYSLLSYTSYVREDESLYSSPIMNYYFEYFLKLMSPAGIVPDFGDADWGHSWVRYIPFFEKGGAVYKKPEYRWAAAQYFRKYLEPMPERKSIFAALCLSDAYLWADFTVEAREPTGGSEEVLEDIVGKKFVFRDGFDANDTYLLHNYRDEGDGGWLYREYLRNTIPVEEEKMHHGHADENSIVLLMKNNSILLHDGGYRDFMPSGPYGQFRADYFHNRVSVRDGKIALGQKAGEWRYATQKQAAVPGQSMLDFFRNSGAYRQVRTQKIDFLTLTHFDMSRARVIDAHLGYEGDRIITYIKDLDWFVVFDGLKFTKDTYLTFANIWHTRKIYDQGPDWYVTGYDSLRRVEVAGDERLLIHFPHKARLTSGVEPLKRYYQDEKAIYQMIGRHGYPNDMQAFVTILAPISKSASPEKIVESVRLLEVDAFPEAVGVEIQTAEKKYVIGAKLDLQKELIRDWRRPQYNYASGKTRYGDYETDAYHMFVVETAQKIHFAMSGAVKIKYKDRVLHEQKPAQFGLNFDGSPDLPGTGKLRYWEEEVNK